MSDVIKEGSIEWHLQNPHLGNSLDCWICRHWGEIQDALDSERAKVKRLREALQSANCYMADPTVCAKLGDMVVFGAAALAEA